MPHDEYEEPKSPGLSHLDPTATGGAHPSASYRVKIGSALQVDETVGFADDEDPSDGLVSDRRDEGLYLEEPEKDSAVMAEGLPKVSLQPNCQLL